MIPSVRFEKPEDAEAVRAVHVACFPTSDEADLVDALRTAGRLTLSLVAEADDEVVGHVGFSPVSAGNGSAGLGLAPLAVLETYRRHGIGAQLVLEGLEAARFAGYGWIAVLGDPAYYGRFGFVPAPTVGLSDEYGGGGAFQVLEIAPGELPRGGGLVTYSPEFARFGGEDAGAR